MFFVLQLIRFFQANQFAWIKIKTADLKIIQKKFFLLLFIFFKFKKKKP